MSSFKTPDSAQRIGARELLRTRVAGRQRWNHLLFGHWEVDAEKVQSTLPRGLFADTHEGRAYLGIVPFFMQRVRPAWLPAVPLLSWFLELNVRTYVHDAEGRPGVWFYSLDCNQPVAVWLARRFYHLPYFRASMTANLAGDSLRYSCRRAGSRSGSADYTWKTGKAGRPAEPGSLDYFLVERYRLFAADGAGQLYEGHVYHEPYRLFSPAVETFSTLPAQSAGFALEGPPVSLLGADAVDVSIFPLKRCG